VKKDKIRKDFKFFQIRFIIFSIEKNILFQLARVCR
jgi:hypothetical protein